MPEDKNNAPVDEELNNSAPIENNESDTSVDDDEWNDAFDDVLGDKKETPKPEDEDESPEEGEKPTGETNPNDTPDDKKDEEEQPTPSTSEIVRDALKEAENIRISNEETRKAYHQEVIDSLYPEGVGRQLVDAEGNPINGVGDLVKLINPETNEYFTRDEAADYLLAAQQKLNTELADFDKNIDTIVDTNISIQDGSIKVQKEYGELLKSMPDVAQKLQEAYFKTLVIDKKTNIIIKATVPVDEFYEAALLPYKRVATQMELKVQGEQEAAAKAAKDAEIAAEAAKKAAEEAKKQAEKKSQSEREDIPSNGQSVRESKDDEEWGDAMSAILGPKRR